MPMHRQVLFVLNLPAWHGGHGFVFKYIRHASAGKSIAAPVQGLAWCMLRVAIGVALPLLLSFLSAVFSSDDWYGPSSERAQISRATEGNRRVSGCAADPDCGCFSLRSDRRAMAAD